MSKALVVTGLQRPYIGAASFAVGKATGYSLFANRTDALDINAAQRKMAQVLGSPLSIEPSVSLPGRLVPQSAISNAMVPFQTAKAKTTQIVQLTVDTQPKKSLWQTVTQPKVVIVAGTVMAVAGAAAACYFFPVASAAHASTIAGAGHAFAMNTHQLFIQPGIANTMMLADLVLQAAVVPAAKLSLPILLPVISTAIVTTLGTLLLIYLANQAWKVAKVALWGAGTAVVQRFNHECDQTYFGMAARAVFMKSVFPCGVPPMLANLSPSAPQAEAVSSVPAAVVAQKEVVQSAPLQITGFVADPSVQVISKEEAKQIEAGKVTRNERGQQAQAAALARKAQIKAQRTWMEIIAGIVLVTAAGGAIVYIGAEAKPDFESIAKEF